VNYLERLAAEIERRVPNRRLPMGDTRRLFLMYAVLARAKGDEVTAEDVHDAWAAWMTLDDEDHDSLVEYSRLDQETRGEDDVFVRAIRDAARSM
jgi:hypothetical protein